MSLVEINEAFASMTVGTIRVLGLDPDIVQRQRRRRRPRASGRLLGARMLVTLAHELRRRGGGFGVASLCAGGGMGVATVIEVVGAVVSANSTNRPSRGRAITLDQ